MTTKNKSKQISGVITALVTPFYKGRVDFKSVKKLLKYQLDNGVQGFVVNGTTGESPTLEWDEVERLYKFVKKEVDTAVPVIIGTGSNSTADTIKATKLAKKLKADAALVVCPYYNKPSQAGLMQHYTAIAKASQFPIILYNVPSRTVVSISPETAAQLSKIKNIIGIKDACGQIADVAYLLKNSRKDFLLLSGDDRTCIDFQLAGGQGVISVNSHIIPKQLRRLSDLARAGDREAQTQYKKFEELNTMLAIDPNPTPVKMMLYLMGIINSPELRLPLLTAEGQNKANMARALKTLDLI